jgi:hypothetical protein
MAERRMTHKGHSIVIHDDPGEVAVTINELPVRIFGSSDSGYWTPYRAYQKFDSLDNLARAVAELAWVPE